MVAKVTNIRPTIEDELTELLLNSDSFVIIGKSEGDIKMASNADHKEVYMMLDVLKEESWSPAFPRRGRQCVKKSRGGGVVVSINATYTAPMPC